MLRNLRRSIIAPITVYLLSLILPVLVISIPALIFHWNSDYQLAHAYILGTLGQALMDLPTVVLFNRLRERLGNEAGIQNKTRDRVVSMIVGFVCALLLAAIRVLITGKLMGGRFMGGVPAFTQATALRSPWNIIAAVSALFAYGPGEALFVVYLILAFDEAFGNPRSFCSWGVIITALLWALPHLFNVVYFGLSAIPNILMMFFIGIGMGILLKKTRSALGPLIFWTLVNGTSA